MNAEPSAAQVNYLGNLIADRDVSGLTIPADIADGLTRREASALIDALKGMPRKAAQTAASGPSVDAGIYFHNGTVIKVQRAVHGSGNLYAKALNAETGKFEYAPGLIRTLTGVMRMTLAQAEEFGALYGMCCNCGRTLTDEESIAAGIGPVCARKFS